MNAKVIAINKHRSMIAAIASDGDHIVFEGDTDAFSKHDELSEIKDEHGDQEIYNHTTDSWEDIRVEGLQATRASAFDLIR